MKEQRELSGGILVLVIKDGQGIYYFGDNSFWLLDDWVSEISEGIYTNELASLKVDPKKWPDSFLRRYRPELIINLDQKILISNYYDQALERRIPNGWEGRWIERGDDFLDEIPPDFRYWEIVEST